MQGVLPKWLLGNVCGCTNLAIQFSRSGVHEAQNLVKVYEELRLGDYLRIDSSSLEEPSH